MLRKEFGDFPLDTRDGIKVTLPDGWFLVRGSNTEPIIRIVAEAESEQRAREIVSGVYQQVANSINV
jgi:phosphomannomutase